MPIPLGTDQYHWRRPVATLTLIALNAGVWVAMLLATAAHEPAAKAQWVDALGLSWQRFHWWQPITYQFMHDPNSIWHIAGNMLFLWVFGSSVEARMRWWGFAAFYLLGGALAGTAEVLWSDGRVIGASGAVTGVTGAFIVLYPRARVNIFLLVSVMPVPAMLLVLLYLALDVLGATGLKGSGVAHLAHLTGFVYGAIVAFALLGSGALKRTDMDLLYLLRQARRRAEMRRIAASGPGGVWRTDAERAPPPKEGPTAPAGNAARALPRASGGAERLLGEGAAAFARGDFAAAAAAYEGALTAAPGARDADHTRLMLAVIYGRKLAQPERARGFLHEIKDLLPDHLGELQAALRVEVGA